MAIAKRERWADELEFIDIALHRDGNELTGGMALPSRENLQPQFPDKDYDSIAKELGSERRKVAYAVHQEDVSTNAKAKPRSRYVLTGSFGEGENYDPELDPKVAPVLQAARIAKLMTANK